MDCALGAVNGGDAMQQRSRRLAAGRYVDIANDDMGSDLYSVRRRSGARLVSVSLGTPERIPVNVKRFPHKCLLKH